ncbi:MAG: hypothetical protein U1E04_10710 [Hylemonella sp.]|nr:hypothetical protein [Hylemonella sp.]
MRFPQFDELFRLRGPILFGVLYGVVCSIDFDWKGVFSHTAIFSICMASILIAERTTSISRAVQAIHARSHRIYWTVFFASITVGVGVYYGYELLRALIEAVLAFMFFLAFSGIGNQLRRSK